MSVTATIVVGNPNPASRTLKVATAALEALVGDADVSVTTIDLAEYMGSLFDWKAEDVGELTAQVKASDILIVSSPTYKGTYTGLLKVFMDRFGAGSLNGIAAFPVMTGGDKSHTLAPDTGLHSLLKELGAATPASGLYVVVEDQQEQIDATITEWGTAARTALGRLGSLAGNLSL